MAGERLAQRLSNNINISLDTNFLYGEVISIEPIKIKVNGLPEFQASQIILGKNVKEYKIKIPTNEITGHTHKIKELTTTEAGEDNHTHKIQAFETEKSLEEITLWENLKVGDKVFLIQSNDKQRIYVMEKIENDTSN